jgi:hypothetical protein
MDASRENPGRCGSRRAGARCRVTAEVGAALQATGWDGWRGLPVTPAHLGMRTRLRGPPGRTPAHRAVSRRHERSVAELPDGHQPALVPRQDGAGRRRRSYHSLHDRLGDETRHRRRHRPGRQGAAPWRAGTGSQVIRGGAPGCASAAAERRSPERAVVREHLPLHRRRATPVLHAPARAAIATAAARLTAALLSASPRGTGSPRAPRIPETAGNGGQQALRWRSSRTAGPPGEMLPIASPRRARPGLRTPNRPASSPPGHTTFPRRSSAWRAACQVSACPSRNVCLTAVQSPGSSGPPQASSRAASTGVCASSARAQVPRRSRSAITNGTPAPATPAAR